MNKTIVIIVVGSLVLLAIVFWLYKESTKPLPGEKQDYNCDNDTDFSKVNPDDLDDKCRVHVSLDTEVSYQTNPPVFGPHDAEWTRAGVYSEIKNDRNLVHSLEHGYVILSYKCKVQSAKSEEATISAQSEFNSDCQNRKSQLEKVYNQKGTRKLIVVPRVNLETNFALTSWGYLDKFDDFDENRIIKFIDAHRDNGPERTME